MATTKDKGGRPSKYDAKYDDQAYKLCLLGADDSQLADFFEVNEDTINEWKKRHPTFSESLKTGKGIADANVAKSLYHRATGYEHPEVDIKMYEGEIIITDITKRYPPDTTAAIFWLKNRQRSKWRDKQDVEHTGRDGAPIVFDIMGTKSHNANNSTTDTTSKS